MPDSSNGNGQGAGWAPVGESDLLLGILPCPFSHRLRFGYGRVALWCTKEHKFEIRAIGRPDERGVAVTVEQAAAMLDEPVELLEARLNGRNLKRDEDGKSDEVPTTNPMRS